MELTTIETESFKITLVPCRYTDPRNTWNSKTRVYAPYTAPDMEEPAFSIKGQDEELDAAWRKYNRAEVKLMREVLAKAADEIGDVLMNEDNELFYTALQAIKGKLSWSRTAGCSCGCSMGFIAARQHVIGDGRLTDRIRQVSVDRK